jgi:aromatic-L-amino-acid decarboxylase
MDADEFRRAAHRLVDWMADYREDIAAYPVKAQVRPGEVTAQLPARAGDEAEPFDRIFADFLQILLPGITHWQHPRFFAYFPANASLPSLLGEMLTSALGAQCMSWATSPAATELETVVMRWLADALGLGDAFTGVIQDTASTSTLAALLTARERSTGFASNDDGLAGGPRFTVYCSEEAHSSVEKACGIAGIGRRNLRHIPTDEAQAMRPEALEAAIAADLAAGRRPLMVVAALGTTATTAIDPIDAIADICRRHGLWLHVDAALAGAALLLPEYADLARQARAADSFVFNPHKWLFTHFDCSAYFVRDPDALVRTFAILPEYLRTAESGPVVNYRDWGPGLGRRFRALKLWFVMRSFGLEGLRSRLRAHLAMARDLAARVEAHPDFEITAPVPFNLVCFRWCPAGRGDLDALNLALMEALNASGRLYLTHARVRGAVTLRLVVGTTDVTPADVAAAWDDIVAAAATL